MSAITTTAIMSMAGSLIKLIDKLMLDRAEKAKKDWNEIKNLYNIEKAKPRDQWDADAILNIYQKMHDLEQSL